MSGAHSGNRPHAKPVTQQQMGPARIARDLLHLAGMNVKPARLVQLGAIE